jgi:hypothetical protein
VAEDARPALLGAQDRQCLEQAAQEPAIEGQAHAPGDLDGRDQEGCTRRVRRLHQNLRHQIREGSRMPVRGARVGSLPLYPPASSLAGARHHHGHHKPLQLTAQTLMRLTPRLPAGWAEQRKLLGFR